MGGEVFVEYAAQGYDVEVVGVTVSEEQARLARERCKDLPAEIRLLDYREVDETFGRGGSIGMFDHVGPQNYKTYMETMKRCLTEDGLSMLHTIGSPESHRTTDPWIEKYIFPSGGSSRCSTDYSCCSRSLHH